MRAIRKSAVPQALQMAISDGISYDGWGRDVSQEVREAIAADQYGLCCYCERTLRMGDTHKTKIEHFHPRSADQWIGRPQKEWRASACSRESGARDHQVSKTAWSNLLLACSGVGSEETCDTKKGGSDICADFPNPAQTSRSNLVVIQRGGVAAPANGMHSGSGRVINDVLNLNAHSLREARRAMMAEYYKEYNSKKSRAKGLSAVEKRKAAKRIRGKAAEHRQSFPSALVAVAREIETKAEAMR